MWIVSALLFRAAELAVAGVAMGGEYLTGCVVEKSLSVDNVFVFALIFSYFAAPARYQYRVLFWGVVGALILHSVFVLVGAELLERHDWMISVFGVFLVYTGIRVAFHRDAEVHFERNQILRVVRRFVPTTSDSQREKFFVRRAGKLLATPLFRVVVVVGNTEVVFAVDSLPAIFAITSSSFVVCGARTLPRCWV